MNPSNLLHSGKKCKDTISSYIYTCVSFNLNIFTKTRQLVHLQQSIIYETATQDFRQTRWRWGINYPWIGVAIAVQVYVKFTINDCLIWFNSSALVTSGPSPICNDERERERWETHKRWMQSRKHWMLDNPAPQGV